MHVARVALEPDAGDAHLHRTNDERAYRASVAVEWNGSVALEGKQKQNIIPRPLHRVPVRPFHAYRRRDLRVQALAIQTCIRLVERHGKALIIDVAPACRAAQWLRGHSAAPYMPSGRQGLYLAVKPALSLPRTRPCYPRREGKLHDDLAQKEVCTTEVALFPTRSAARTLRGESYEYT